MQIGWNAKLMTLILIVVLKYGFPGGSGVGFQILEDLASTYMLHRPCILSLYFGRSQSSELSDWVVNK